MADSIITALPELETIADSDVLSVVDISDPTQAVTGTTKKVKRSTIVDGLATDAELSTGLSGKSDTTHNHDTAYEAKNSNIQSHISSTSNPHNTTKAQIGLTNVPNLDTTNAVNNQHTHSNKTELDKVTDGDHDVRTDNPHAVTKAQVGLTNVTDVAQLAASLKGAVNGVAELGSDGKVPSAQLPAIAMTDVSVAASEIEQLALTGQGEGDVCVRTDEDKTYIHNGGTAGTMSDWTLMRTPSAANVSSVFGRTGAVAAANGDYNAGNITNTPAGTIEAITVQAALNELDTDKSPTTHNHDTAYVAKNAAITGATKTKITYDAKGLVTEGADATTADIADSTNKRYVTDAEKTVIGNTSNTNSGNETATTIGALVNGATAKDTPIDADIVGFVDTEASNVFKKITWTNIKAFLKTYFDTLYLALSGGTITGNILLAENAAMQLDTVLSADEKYCGIVEVGTMGYAATAGDLVYLDAAAGNNKWEKAKADAAVTSGGVKLGIVTVTTAENGTCEVLLWGKIRSAAFPAAFTVGAPVYVSAATAGAVVVAAPTGTTNFVVRIIGYGNTAEDLFFCPDNTFLELA
jgi:hypothetical protein